MIFLWNNFRDDNDKAWSLFKLIKNDIKQTDYQSTNTLIENGNNVAVQRARKVSLEIEKR